MVLLASRTNIEFWYAAVYNVCDWQDLFWCTDHVTISPWRSAFSATPLSGGAERAASGRGLLVSGPPGRHCRPQAFVSAHCAQVFFRMDVEIVPWPKGVVFSRGIQVDPMVSCCLPPAWELTKPVLLESSATQCRLGLSLMFWRQNICLTLGVGASVWLCLGQQTRLSRPAHLLGLED